MTFFNTATVSDRTDFTKLFLFFMFLDIFITSVAIYNFGINIEYNFLIKRFFNLYGYFGVWLCMMALYGVGYFIYTEFNNRLLYVWIIMILFAVNLSNLIIMFSIY